MSAEGDSSEKPRTPVILPTTPCETKEFQDLYPARRERYIPNSLIGRFFRGYDVRNTSSQLRMCENIVIDCLEKYPMVRTILGALEGVGCPVDIDRHIVCEMCPDSGLTSLQYYGGYDDRHNQIFICANHATTVGYVHGLLVRNLIHMYDRCVAKVDFRNLDHLACMEVRKANLGLCNYMNYFSRSGAKMAVKEQHQECVKSTAIDSLVDTKFVSRELAEQAVKDVFNKCYKDLEPFGRRCRKSSDFDRAHNERYLYGYH